MGSVSSFLGGGPERKKHWKPVPPCFWHEAKIFSCEKYFGILRVTANFSVISENISSPQREKVGKIYVTAPPIKSFRGKFSPYFFLKWEWWTLNHQKTKEIRPEPALLHPCHVFGREMAQTQPPCTPLTRNSLICMQKCYVTIVWPQMSISGEGH